MLKGCESHMKVSLTRSAVMEPIQLGLDKNSTILLLPRKRQPTESVTGQQSRRNYIDRILDFLFPA